MPEALRYSGRGYAACFVTFKRRGPGETRLRGCLGTLEPREALWQAVARLSAESVTEDSRFREDPVTLSELPQLHIEISVLHPRRLLRDPLSITLGMDGIALEGQGLWEGRRGVYLPQVAAECKFSKEEFLSSCCESKAGLPPQAWRDPLLCRVYGFRAEVFGE